MRYLIGLVLTANVAIAASISWSSGSSSSSHTNGNSVSVSTSCSNGVCRSCINDRCFDRQYSDLTAISGCPTAACETTGCQGLVWDNDNCPICSCDGFSTREPCDTEKDCGQGGTCTNQLCRYPPVPQGLPQFCMSAYQCKETDNCVGQKCQQDSAGRSHLPGQSCVFSNQCPSGYTCDSMTCWAGGATPAAPVQSCMFDYQCPTQYSCQQMKCTKTGKEHGTSPCVMASQCAQGQNCVNMTCQ